MNYNEDLLVELIADSELTHGEIAQRVGVSRRTVWLIANGRSRPDLQQQIADTVEGYRQAAIRLAAKHMRVVLEKQIQVALADNGETSRKAREFLLKNFMNALVDEPARSVEKRRTRLAEKKQVQAELNYELDLAIKKQKEEMTNEQFDADWDECDDDDNQYAADNEAAPVTGNPAWPTIVPPADNTQTEPPEPVAQHSDGRTEPAPSPGRQNTERETADPVQTEDVFAQSRRIMAQASQAALAGYD
jgi:DNA-binding XRE family transcriptional regulator